MSERKTINVTAEDIERGGGGGMTAKRRRAGHLEVHEHHWLRGPNANKTWLWNCHHSHLAGGDGHAHPDTGPAAFTIDRDEWLAATGLIGGGRKTFTKTPVGPQLPRVELEPSQREFTVVFVDRGLTPEHIRAGITEEELQEAREEFAAAAVGQPSPAVPGENGHGGAAVARLVLALDMTPHYVYEDRRGETPAVSGEAS